MPHNRVEILKKKLILVILTTTNDRFNVTEFSRGNIMGLQTGAALGVRDVFYLGRFAYMQNKPYVALNWLYEATNQASIVNDKTIEENQVCTKYVFNRLSYF